MAHLIFLSSAFQGLKNKGRLEIFSLRKQRGGWEGGGGLNPPGVRRMFSQAMIF